MVKLKGLKFNSGYSLPEHGVTQGLLGMFIDCRVRCRWWLDMWEQPGSRLPLLFGTAGHEVLEGIYRYYAQNKRPRKLDALGEEVRQLAVSLVGTWSERERAVMADQGLLEDLEYIEWVLPSLMQEYAKFYATDFTRLKWVGLEQEFANDFDGYLLRGKRDGVFRVKSALWVLETKFKGQIRTAELNDTLAFDFQNLFYLLNTELEMVGKRMGGVLYNIVRRPQLRQGKDEDWGAFCQRVADDAAKRPEFYFVRFELAYPKKVIRAFRDDLAIKLQDFEAWLNGRLPTYKNEAACTTVYGRCNYLQACAQGTPAGYVERERIFPELDTDIPKEVE